jgi:hypothetical protein
MHNYNDLFPFIVNEFRENSLDESSVVLESCSCGLRIVGWLNGTEDFVGLGFEEGDLLGEVVWVVPGTMKDKNC